MNAFALWKLGQTKVQAEYINVFLPASPPLFNQRSINIFSLLYQNTHIRSTLSSISS
jgi:hypothetical protein